METIKKFFSNIWWTIATTFGIIITIFGVILFVKNRTIQSLIADLSKAKTNEEVNNLEKEIVAINTRKDLNEQELAELNKALELLAKKKIELKDSQSNTTVQDNLDFWNK